MTNQKIYSILEVITALGEKRRATGEELVRAGAGLAAGRLLQPDDPAALPGRRCPPAPRELAEGRGPPGSREHQVGAGKGGPWGGAQVPLCRLYMEAHLGSWSRKDMGLLRTQGQVLRA